MIEWLTRHEWLQESEGGFAKTVSFLAFIAMPGCIFGAIIERIFFNKWRIPVSANRTAGSL